MYTFDIKEINKIRDSLNGWNDSFSDNFYELVKRVQFEEASFEERAVLATGLVVIGYDRGAIVQFQLPSTREVFAWNGKDTLTIVDNRGDIHPYWEDLPEYIVDLHNRREEDNEYVRFLYDTICGW